MERCTWSSRVALFFFDGDVMTYGDAFFSSVAESLRASMRKRKNQGDDGQPCFVACVEAGLVFS